MKMLVFFIFQVTKQICIRPYSLYFRFTLSWRSLTKKGSPKVKSTKKKIWALKPFLQGGWGTLFNILLGVRNWYPHAIRVYIYIRLKRDLCPDRMRVCWCLINNISIHGFKSSVYRFNWIKIARISHTNLFVW